MVRMKEIVRAEDGEVFDIELEADILKANKELADLNKEILHKYGVVAIDIMSSISNLNQ